MFHLAAAIPDMAMIAPAAPPEAAETVAASLEAVVYTSSPHLQKQRRRKAHSTLLFLVVPRPVVLESGDPGKLGFEP